MRTTDGNRLSPVAIAPRWLFSALAIGLFASLNGSPALGQAKQQMLTNPPDLQEQREQQRRHDVSVTLDIKYGDNLVYNPQSKQDDKVHLRSYNGSLVGPTINVAPGDTLRVRLRNMLPPETCIHPEGTHNIPNCFNVTNLHTHGWHVSPTGNSDNVFLEIPPDGFLDYEFNLPDDHPAGTFWYHAHRHGATALQVSSGMVGALVIHGDRQLRDKATNGQADVDTILEYTNGKPFDERIFLFEQIQYACTDYDDAGNQVFTWNCSGKDKKGKDKVGTIEQYGQQFGSSSWRVSGRYTLINGKVLPTFETQAGKIERWRLIHGGVRDTIKFKIVRSNEQLASREAMLAAPAPSAAEIQSLADAAAALPVTSQFEIAVDGLTRTRMSQKDANILQPGYRSDVLVFFDRPGVYYLLDDAAPTGRINAEDGGEDDRRLLAKVYVRGGDPVEGAPREYLARQIVAANGDLPGSVKKGITERLDLSEFTPHADIPASAVTVRKPLEFNLDISTPNTRFGIDHQAYRADRIDHTLALGGVEEWAISSTFANHPFHIHVNPFQIVQILKPDGTPVVDAQGKCNDGADPQYCDQIGVFRDTILVKQDYKVIVRFRVERYIGDFVLHCHILDHEDQGMMQNVRIVPSTEVQGHVH